MAKVSVIVPVYGVEQYIERCARSLFEQTLDDIEYIFVNDCTKDNSISVLKAVITEYPNREDQIKIINHDVNKGLPQARKTGVMNATGEYIAHCDSDDWVDKNTYQIFYDKAVEDNADVVISDYYRHSDGGDVLCKGCVEGLNSASIYKGMLFGKVPYMVWNKLVRHSLYENIQNYPEYTHAEDLALMIQLCFYAKNISYVPLPFYYYVVNSNTPLHIVNDGYYLRNFNESVANAKLLDTFFNELNVSSILKDGLVYIKSAQRNLITSLIQKDKKYYKLWLNTFPEINNRILFIKEIPFKHKIKYILIRMGFSKKL